MKADCRSVSKSAVGQMDFWHRVGRTNGDTDRGVDFITIDGGEGGTGAAPLVFSDHVAIAFQAGDEQRLPPSLWKRDLHKKIVFIGSGKLGFPETALLAFGLGCDMINVGREAMLADWLYSGAAVSHGALSNRSRHAESLVNERPGPNP